MPHHSHARFKSPKSPAQCFDFLIAAAPPTTSRVDVDWTILDAPPLARLVARVGAPRLDRHGDQTHPFHRPRFCPGAQHVPLQALCGLRPLEASEADSLLPMP